MDDQQLVEANENTGSRRRAKTGTYLKQGLVEAGFVVIW